jgi:hypothetical protein
VTWEQDLGWGLIGLGALQAVVPSVSLLDSLYPERARQRGGPGYHKRTVAEGGSAARSELLSRLVWCLYLAAFGLTFVTRNALWAEVVLGVVVTMLAAGWIAPWVRRRRQNGVRKSN